MRRITLNVAIIALVLLLAPLAGSAQDYRGRLQGSVIDETRAVLPGVSVTLRNDATGVTSAFVTNEVGHYVFDFVDPGVYSITAELPGFKKAEQKNVRMPQRGSLTVD